jgi:glycosyltransferase involved in cell wall biosynthesis
MTENQYNVSQGGWLTTLVRHLPGPALAGLRDYAARAETAPDEAPPAAGDAVASTTGRLLAFYIDKARAGCRAPQADRRDQARQELALIRAALDARAAEPPAVDVRDRSAAGAPLPNLFPEVDPADPTLAKAIRLVYEMTVGRRAVDEEIDIWRQNFQNGVKFHDFVLLMRDGDESRSRREQGQILPETGDGDFIQLAHRIIESRGALPNELDHYRQEFRNNRLNREQLLKDLFTRAVLHETNEADAVVHDGLSCWIMGTSHTLTLTEWQEKARDTGALKKARKTLRHTTPFHIGADPGMRVSAITSLYCGGDFIEQFMDNITSQTCFGKHCELIIVDAESPENEAQTIERYLRDHPNIRYKRMNSRIGIYEAWNIGVEMAEGKYLTNANLDDLRRDDSFEIQAGVLDTLPFVDVVYQDFYYSFDPRLNWDEVAAFNYKSTLPVITHHNMQYFNSPHNAPMWRKSLHDELGLFDASFKSAGDYEFWLRCLTAKKRFFKVNEPHVVYYQNPKGLSTRADTRGVVEAKAISRKYAPLLTARRLTCDFDEFLRELANHDADIQDFPHRDRYLTSQRALRDLTRRFKQGEM